MSTISSAETPKKRTSDMTDNYNNNNQDNSKKAKNAASDDDHHDHAGLTKRDRNSLSEFFRKSTVADIIKTNSKPLVTLNETDSMRVALETLNSNKISSGNFFLSSFFSSFHIISQTFNRKKRLFVLFRLQRSKRNRTTLVRFVLEA